MNTATTPVEGHVHLDLDVDREGRFHYRSQGRNGHRLTLHRGDSVTFTCSEEFTIRLEGGTPFEEAVLHSRHCFINAHVRRDAPAGRYEYIAEVSRGDESVTDPGRATTAHPEIVVEM